MKTFIEYAEKRDREELIDVGISPGKSGVGLGDMSGAANSPDDILLKIAKIAIKDHHQELMDCFEELASKDQKIRQELDNYNKANNSGTRKGMKPQHPMPPDLKDDDDRDVVVPNPADGFGGYEEN